MSRLIGLMLLALAACAVLIYNDTATGAETGDTWITGGAKSYHGDRTVKHNELNIGIGLETYLSPDLRVGLSLMENSFWKPSVQGYTMYTPWSAGEWKFGGLAGLASGYGRWPEPAVLGAATWERGRFGLDVVGFPPISTFKGFAAVRLKFKWEGK